MVRLYTMNSALILDMHAVTSRRKMKAVPGPAAYRLSGLADVSANTCEKKLAMAAKNTMDMKHIRPAAP